MRKALLLGGLCLLLTTSLTAQAAQTAKPEQQGAKPPAAANQDRKEVKVPEKVLKTYVGEYELTPERILTITLEKGYLWGQPTGQESRQMFPESQTKFFLKDAPVEVTFQTEKGKVVGLTMKQGDRPERELKKIK